MALPGQYVFVRLKPVAGGPQLFRSYSLSGPISTERYRISVKIEPNGAAGNYLREHLRVGDRLDFSSPRGSFVLQSGKSPIVLLSAGIGAQFWRCCTHSRGHIQDARSYGCTQRGMGSIIRLPAKSAASCAR